MRVSPYAEMLEIARRNTYERFSQADTLARLHLAYLADQGVVLGAFPFGSTQFGDQDPFSDYDVMVAIEDCSVEDETAIFQAIHDTANEIYNRTTVPLEITCLTRTQIMEGSHGLPDSMGGVVERPTRPTAGKHVRG